MAEDERAATIGGVVVRLADAPPSDPCGHGRTAGDSARAPRARDGLRIRGVHDDVLLAARLSLAFWPDHALPLLHKIRQTAP